MTRDFEVDNQGYVPFGDVARNVLGMQCQYASQYITGLGSRPNLSHGLRLKNVDSPSYHEIRIHKDDIEEFVRRVLRHKEGED